MTHDPDSSISERTLLVDNIRVPRFLYGTAWKEDATRSLAELALREGFACRSFLL